MKNIVNSYTTDIVAEHEEGVVAIEYVVVAAATVAALGFIWTNFGTTLAGKLDGIVSGL